MPALTPYLGIVGPATGEKVKNTTLRAREVRGHEHVLSRLPASVLARMHCRPGFSNGLPLSWLGFIHLNRYTYQVDLNQSEADIWDGVEAEQRNRIRKADGKLRLEYPTDAREFYELNRKSFARQKRKTPYSLEWFLDYDEVLKRHDSRTIFVARDSHGRAIAANYTAFDTRAAYCLGIGQQTTNGPAGANAWLMWEVIKYYHRKNLAIFDFEGGNLRNIERFFRSFGGDLVTYSCFVKPPPKMLRLALTLIGKDPLL